MQRPDIGQDEQRGDAPAQEVVNQKSIRTVLSRLTSREQAVVEWVERGLTSKSIAAQLQISPRTVQTHLKRMFKKLGVHSRAELVVQIYRMRGHG